MATTDTTTRRRRRATCWGRAAVHTSVSLMALSHTAAFSGGVLHTCSGSGARFPLPRTHTHIHTRPHTLPPPPATTHSGHSCLRVGASALRHTHGSAYASSSTRLYAEESSSSTQSPLFTPWRVFSKQHTRTRARPGTQKKQQARARTTVLSTYKSVLIERLIHLGRVMETRAVMPLEYVMRGSDVLLGRGPTRIKKSEMLTGMLFALLATLAAVCVPLGYGNLVDAVLLSPDVYPLELRQYSLALALQLLAGIYVAEPFFTWLYVRRMTDLSSRAIGNLKRAFFHKMLDRGMAYFDRTSVNDVVSHLAQDIQGLKDVLFANVQRDRGLRACMESIVGLLILFRLQPKLALLFVAVIPTLATLTSRLGQRLTRAAIREGLSLNRENGQAMEVVRNIREVRSFGTEAPEAARFEANLLTTLGISQQAGRNRALMEATTRAAIFTSIFAINTLGGYFCQRGILGPSALVSFTGYCFSLNFAIQGVNYSYADFRRAVAMSQRLKAFLEAPKEVRSPGILDNKVNVKKLPAPFNTWVGNLPPPLIERGLVEFQDVSFTYPNTDAAYALHVLSHITLTLRPGTVTALVGHSGAGKSTMAQLLSKFYLPTTGRILLDGSDLAKLDHDTVAREVALVGQSPNLFTGSLFYNIAYGARDFSDPQDLRRRVEAAARQANAMEFIEQLPQGLNTQIGGDSGVQLSGGQRQRIAIARAILKDSKILILDEATSALDGESEALVQEALDNLMKGRTTLVMAHRLNTVVNADNIVVLKKGEVVETGRHADLMSSRARGFYRSLMAAQQGAFNRGSGAVVGAQ